MEEGGGVVGTPGGGVAGECGVMGGLQGGLVLRAASVVVVRMAREERELGGDGGSVAEYLSAVRVGDGGGGWALDVVGRVEGFMRVFHVHTRSLDVGHQKT